MTMTRHGIDLCEERQRVRERERERERELAKFISMLDWRSRKHIPVLARKVKVLGQKTTVLILNCSHAWTQNCTCTACTILI